MLKYIAIIPLFVLCALGYATQAVYGETMNQTINQRERTKPVLEKNNTKVSSDAEASAGAFAERVATLNQLLSSSSLSTSDALVFRSVITDRFHEAFTAITRLEKQGRFADAALAREMMQIAIDEHMHNVPDHTPQITRDLETFSKFMTETLIERSALSVP